MSMFSDVVIIAGFLLVAFMLRRGHVNAGLAASRLNEIESLKFDLQCSRAEAEQRRQDYIAARKHALTLAMKLDAVGAASLGQDTSDIDTDCRSWSETLDRVRALALRKSAEAATAEHDTTAITL